jgi:hypothetical protein
MEQTPSWVDVSKIMIGPINPEQRRAIDKFLKMSLAQHRSTFTPPPSPQCCLVADEPQREADQDRREGRQPRALCHFMAEVAVPRHLFADVLRLIAELRPPPVTSKA